VQRRINAASMFALMGAFGGWGGGGAAAGPAALAALAQRRTPAAQFVRRDGDNAMLHRMMAMLVGDGGGDGDDVA